MDLSGLGDSPTRPGRTEGVEFLAAALKDMADMCREITTEFGPELMLVGLCSGGYDAIETVLLEPVISLCAVNPAISLSPGTYARTGASNPTLKLHQRSAPWPIPGCRTWWRCLRRCEKRHERLPVAGGYSSGSLVTEPRSALPAPTESGVEVLIAAGHTDAQRLREQ